ncbi:MAG: hypothetical protein ACSLFQ_02070 [Thermoanaerobaculia bacterium]
MLYVPKDRNYSYEKNREEAENAAREHATNGIAPMADLVIKSHLIQWGKFDPTTNEEHAELQRQRQLADEHMPKVEASIEKVDELLEKYPGLWLLRLLFVFFLGVEYAALNELLAGQGMDNPHRTIVAIAGACILFYLTYCASKGAES